MNGLFSSGALRYLLACAGVIAASSAFGGIATFWLSQRTRILMLTLFFALSLLLLGIGFALDSLSPMITNHGPVMEILANLFRIGGVVLNIAVSPLFVAGLCSAALPGAMRIALRLWAALAVTLSLFYPFLRHGEIAAIIVSAQLIVTVGASVIWTAARLRCIAFAPLRRALSVFVRGTIGFLALIVLDMAITIVPIGVLSPIDNLSLPLYLLALSVGLFFFARALFASGPLVEEGTVTDVCRNRFDLTEREAEIVAKLLGGGSNQDVADSLFISKKTLENHLLKVYRKMGVRSRIQLLQTLQDWKRQV